MKQLLQTLFFFLLVTQICFGQWVQTSLDSCIVKCIIEKDSNLFTGTIGYGLFRSTDKGIHWEKINGLPTPYIGALTASSTNLFYGPNYGIRIPLDTLMWGVFVSSDNGTSWTTSNNRLKQNIRSLTFSGTNLFAGTGSTMGGGSVFVSTDNGTTWVQTALPEMWAVNALFVNETNLFAGTYSQGVFLSTNNGSNWASVNVGLPKNVYDTTIYISVNCFEAIEQNLFAGTDAGIFLSTNNGTSWTQTSMTYSVNTLVVAGQNLFAGTESHGVCVSNNNGNNWTEVNSGLTNTEVYAVAVSSTNLFAGTQAGVWRRPIKEMIPVELTSFTASASGAEVILNWSTATELNNYGFEIQRKAFDGDFATVAFVKGQGTTTQQNQYSFADKNLDEGKYFYRLKQMDYGGQFSYSQIVEVDVRTLDNYTLEQNYPNPFNPTTTIGYVLQEKSNAKLTLLNSLGEEIAVLINEDQDKGYHKVEFDGSRLASGVYFYRLQAGSFEQTRKMILLK